MSPATVAQISPLTPEFQLGLISVLGLVVLVLSILAFFKRKPPVGEDLVQLRASIDALKGAVEHLTKAHEKHVTHAAEIEALQEKVRKLETLREEDQARNRSYTAQSTERIFKRIDELAASVSANFQSVERTLGQLEGKVSALADR